MISDRFIRESEVASSTHSAKKSVAPKQKFSRMKTKALGDVQNTLHSRAVNFSNTNSNSSVKSSNRISVHSKHALSEKSLSFKSTASEKKLNVTPVKSAKKLLLSTSLIEEEILETHNHILCEQDEQFYVNDYLRDYKFSEEQINNLTRSVKISVTPISARFFEPCTDIEIPDVYKFEKDIFSVSDILRDLHTPQIPAPLEAL